MLIDTHLHECTHSPDSFMTLRQIVDQARRLGLQAVCITDHESNGLTETAARMSRLWQYPIFVGAEYLTDCGDLTVFGLSEIPDAGMPLSQMLDLVSRAGGACVAAHPFRTNNRGLRDLVKTARGLHGVEVFNGSTDPANNLRALSAAREAGLSLLGGSDAHTTGQVGRFATRFPEGIRSVADLVEAIRSGQTLPVAYSAGVYREAEPLLKGQLAG